MTVIDVAQRAASRDRAPIVSFRRTDADRRPARRVAMPNDGPAPDRLARSEQARQRLLRKPAADQDARPAAGLPLSQRFEENLARCFIEIGSGKSTLADIAPGLGFGVDRCRDFTDALVKRGLVSKELVRRGPIAVCVFSLTEAGRTVWEAR